jgi:hypothetical protein
VKLRERATDKAERPFDHQQDANGDVASDLPALPANFKSWDAVLASYKEAERKIQEQGQENVDLRAEIAMLRNGEAEELLRAHTEAGAQAVRAQVEDVLRLHDRVARIELLFAPAMTTEGGGDA